MSAISAAFWIYVLTIVFALGIAVIIRGAGGAVKMLRLDQEDKPVDISVPTSNSLREEELMAVALVAAHVKNKKR